VKLIEQFNRTTYIQSHVVKNMWTLFEHLNEINNSYMNIENEATVRKLIDYNLRLYLIPKEYVLKHISFYICNINLICFEGYNYVYIVLITYVIVHISLSESASKILAEQLLITKAFCESIEKHKTVNKTLYRIA